MKKLYLSVCILIFTIYAVSGSITQYAGYSLETNSGTTPVIKILPLGNSITFDDFTNDTRPDGLRISYRYTLYNLLSEAGFQFDFVGSEMAGQDLFPDPQNGGFPGITKEQMVTLLQTGYNGRTATQETNGPYLNIIQPDVILLHIGTNNLTTNVDAIDQILNLIDAYRLESGKNVKLLIAKIINRKVYSLATTQYNANLEAVVNAHNHPDNYIVDMENGAGLDYTNDMIDNLHPNSVGYSKMAQLWFNTLVNIFGTSVPCPKPLTGFWNFNQNNAGSFSDVISGYDATAVVEPVVTTGIISNALQFNGSNKVNITNGTLFNKSGSDAFTIQFWIKKSNACNGTNEVIIGRNDASSQLHWWAGIDCSAGNEGKIRFYFRSATGEIFSLQSTTPINDNTWHLITLSRSGSNGKTSLYVDQSLHSSGTFVINGNFNATVPVNIGWLNLSPFYYFSGMLDELAIYTVALGLNEVEAIYQGGLNAMNYCETDFLIAPSDLTATLNINNAVLTWSDNCANEGGYKVERKTGNGSFVQIAQLSANTSNYVDKTLAANTTFYYRVSAFRSTGISGFSNEALVSTSATTVITNVAIGKSSSQSSTAYGGTASRANDGNTNGDWGGNSIAHTNSEINPWWQIDLAASFAIDHIEIWNRINSCCIGRMVNYYVFVSDVPFTSTDLNATINQPGVWNSFNAAYPNPSISISVNRTGRYIRLQLAGQAIINLAEMQILGSPISSPSENIPAMPSSLSATAGSASAITLNWTDQSSNEDGFRIERKTGSNAYAQISEVAVNTHTYIDNNVLGSTTYTYRVYAFNAAGNSPYSNESPATTPEQVTLANVALGKPSLQSSTAYGGIASRGNDGNTNGDWYANSVVHTNDELKPWWQVDLQDAYLIDHINLWNRTNSCCKNRLSNYYIFISNTPFTSNDPNILLNQAGIWSAFNASYPNPNVLIPVHVTGRYVRIQLANQGVINLAEMEVFGNLGTPPEPTIPEAPSSLLSSAGTNTQILLNWSDNSNNESGFRIERKTGNGTFTLLSDVTANQHDFADNTVVTSTSYTYRVYAYNSAGNSVYSNESTITLSEPGIISNLALGKTSVQSTTAYGGVALRANDGNTNGDWNGNSIAHTNNELNPWWQVDLQSIYSIDHIVVWNRTNSCCIGRLTNYYVFVSDVPFASNSLTNTINQSGVLNVYNTNYPNPSTSIPVNRSGRYVRLQLAGQGEINLAELEVYGSTLSSSPQLLFKAENHLQENNPADIEFTAFPSPFAEFLTIQFNLKSETKGTLSVYNLFGQEVIQLYKGIFPEGTNAFDWNGNMIYGKTAPGLYFIKLMLNSETYYHKVIFNP